MASMSSRAGAAGALQASSAADNQDVAARLAALEAENARLKTLLSSNKDGASAGVGSGSGLNSAASAANAPPRSYGSMKLWVGSWNMGAVDPFLDMDIRSNAETVTRMLTPFVPLGYDVYVMGVQEGISDKVFEAVEAHTGTFRLPLNAKLFPARDLNSNGEIRLRSRRMGRAIKAQAFIDEAKAGYRPEPVASTADMLDRVWGRGDGAMVIPKYTGIAVFVAPVVAPYVRLLGMYKHSFGASEGSKGGVGVALGLYDVTCAFINAHMASKRPDMRHAQYSEIVDRLGSKLGGRGFGLNESFHHIVWLGDLNTHCKGIGAKDALALVRTGRHVQLMLQHDELLVEKEEGSCFAEYEEPLMAPTFFPTYKKLPNRGAVDTAQADWAGRTYVTAYKEPFYKGGRVAERVPSWTDRIQYHSLPDRWGELLPEPLDPDAPDSSPHNYRSVNDGLDCSDHSPVYCTFTLEICADDGEEGGPSLSAGHEAAIEAAQAQLGYRQGGAAIDGDSPRALVPTGVMPDADFSALHPSLRPLVVVLQLNNIVVDWGGMSLVPRAVSVLFPLPYEDGNEIPERTKVVRAMPLLSFARQPGADYIGAATRVIVSQARRLESLHLLLKVSLDDNTKAQAVVAMRDGGFVGVGSHMNNFLLPLSCGGCPLKVQGRPASVQFVLEMNAYERGGQQTPAQPTAGVAGQTGPVTYPPHVPGGPSAQRRGTLPTDMTQGQGGPSSMPASQPDTLPGTRRGSMDSSVMGHGGTAAADPAREAYARQVAQAGAAASAAVAQLQFKSPKAPGGPVGQRVGTSPSRPGQGAGAPAGPQGVPAGQPMLPPASAGPMARPGIATAGLSSVGGSQGSARSSGVAATPAGPGGYPTSLATPGGPGAVPPTPGGSSVGSDLARARAAQMMAAARFKAATAQATQARSQAGLVTPGGTGPGGAATVAAAASLLKAKQHVGAVQHSHSDEGQHQPAAVVMVDDE